MTHSVGTFAEFFSRLIQRGLEGFGLYYSIYRGEVSDNNDPESLGRLRVKVPQIYGEEVPEYWAYPAGMGACGVDSGYFDIPGIGDAVYIQFEMGRSSKPVWMPGWWGKKGGAAETPWNARRCPPDVATIRMKSGHRIEFRNKQGEERVLVIASDGSYVDIDAVLRAILIMSRGEIRESAEKDKAAFIGGDETSQIVGSKRDFVGGDRAGIVSGNDKTSVSGGWTIYCGGNANITAGGAVSVKGGGVVAIDGSAVMLNCGAATSSLAEAPGQVEPCPEERV